MASLDDQLFGPLPKQYCELFYYLSVISFIFMLIVLVSTVGIGLTKRPPSWFYFQSAMMMGVYLFGYLQARLLHTMCVHSL